MTSSGIGVRVLQSESIVSSELSVQTEMIANIELVHRFHYKRLQGDSSKHSDRTCLKPRLDREDQRSDRRLESVDSRFYL